MLPAQRVDTPSLADVLTGAFSSIVGEPNVLVLPRVRSAAVILVDGLGMSALQRRAGHARRLLAAIPATGGVIDSGFPTTTASALATLTTGRPAGQHGLVGYSVFDRAADRVVNQLTGWDSGMRPAEWQPLETVFEAAVARKIDAVVVAAERFRHTGFTDAVLRGARFVSRESIVDRIAAAVALLQGSEHALVYVYIPELDKVGHSHGCESDAWTHRLEELDSALAEIERNLPHDAGVLLTADHGMLDVAAHRRIVIDAESELWHDVRHVAGEPRCLHLQVEHREGTHDTAVAVRDRWREAEGSRSWIVTREEAIDAGWFGPVSDFAHSRIGDVIVAARGQVAYYDARSATVRSLAMVGQHGSFSPEEVRVPLARWGSYAI